MTNEEAIDILNDYDINFERHTAEAVAEAHEMAIEALEQQPNKDCISRKDIGLTNLEILMCNGDYKEALKMLLGKIEKAPSVTPQAKAEPKADKALNLLAEWAIECGFGFDNIPEEYEKYKDDIAEMGYTEGLVYIVKMESEGKK